MSARVSILRIEADLRKADLNGNEAVWISV